MPSALSKERVSRVENLETNEMWGTASYDFSNEDITDQSSPCSLVVNVPEVTPLSNPMSSASSSNTKKWTNILQ